VIRKHIKYCPVESTLFLTENIRKKYSENGLKKITKRGDNIYLAKKFYKEHNSTYKCDSCNGDYWLIFGNNRPNITNKCYDCIDDDAIISDINKAVYKATIKTPYRGVLSKLSSWLYIKSDKHLINRKAIDRYYKNGSVEVSKECAYCSNPFVIPLSENAANMYCSSRCYNKSSKKVSGNPKKRAAHYNVEYEYINYRRVFDVDDWRCYICGVKTQKDNIYADDAAELDHVIPLSKGGPHTYDNVRCSCRKCNGDKHDSIIDIDMIKHERSKQLTLEYINEAN